MTDHRSEALTHLRVIRDRLAEELAAVDNAIEVLADDAPAPQSRKQKPKTKPRDRSGEFACLQCSRTFDSQQGLSMHITRTHGRVPDLDAKRAERLAAAVEEANQ